METFVNKYIIEEVSTFVVVLLFFILKYIIFKLVKRFGRLSQVIEHRTNLVIKYFNILLVFVLIIALIFIWGVQPQNLWVAFSSIFAVLGVALFAQWSILSNITSGIILFFSAPYRIGDVIKIHDKDYPIEAEIIDIKGFHTYLKTEEGESIVYPNNLLLQKGISVIEAKIQT
jgi:small-conductance mechanosensitive channel